MACELRSARRLAFVGAALLLCACGTAQETPTATPFGPSVSPSTRPSEAASLAPTANTSVGELHVNAAQHWSIVIPTGWELVGENDSGTALYRGQAIAEILVAPASGLTLEELEAQKVSDLSTWPGAGEIESDFVRLPAGEAVRVTMATTETPTGPRNGFILYVIEEGDTQYVISVRGPHDTHELLTEAEALAESFAILD